MNGAQITFLVIAIVSAIAIIGGLIGGTFAILEPTELGIAIDGTAMRVEPDKIYTSGRFSLGLGWYFVKYPAVVVTTEFDRDTKSAIVARSRDGVVINLDCSIAYRMIKGELHQFYAKFGAEYVLPISKVARDSIRVAAAKFDAFDFFLNRSLVATAISNRLRADFALTHVELNSFQLLDIALPTAFSTAIQNTEITRQQIATAQFQQDRASTEADTQVLAAKQQADVILARARADAKVIAAQALAQASAINQRTSNLLAAYNTTMTQYAMTADQMLTYIWLQALSETTATLTYGYDKPADLLY